MWSARPEVWSNDCQPTAPIAKPVILKYDPMYTTSTNACPHRHDYKVRMYTYICIVIRFCITWGIYIYIKTLKCNLKESDILLKSDRLGTSSSSSGPTAPSALFSIKSALNDFNENLKQQDLLSCYYTNNDNITLVSVACLVEDCQEEQQMDLYALSAKHTPTDSQHSKMTRNCPNVCLQLHNSFAL